MDQTVRGYAKNQEQTRQIKSEIDCGESRDGSGYKNVTASTDPEVKAARDHFAAILATMPEPKPREGGGKAAKKEREKGDQR